MWTAIDKLGVFFVNFFTALKFAAFDYDVTLRRTKTPQQRIIIWFLISATVILVFFILIFFLKRFIQSIAENRVMNVIKTGQ